MQVIKLLTILTGLFLASCAITPNQQAGNNVGKICDLLSSNVEANVSELFKEFGEPNQIEIDFFPNKHLENITDEVHTGSYLDGQVQIYSARGINRNYLMRIVLTENSWNSKIPMYVGKTKNELRKDLGDPQEVATDTFTYHCGEPEYDVVIFHFEDYFVQKLEAVAWID
jgi:hypothetical protein